MKRRLTVVASIICIAAGLAYAQAPSAPAPRPAAEPSRAAEDCRPDRHRSERGHNWRGTTPILRKILEDTGKFEVRVTEEFRGAGPETLAPYDLVVLNYFERGRPELRWGEKTDAAFLDYVRSGKGVVVYHFSMAAFNGWTEYEKLSGGNWRPDNGHHSAPHNFVRGHQGSGASDHEGAEAVVPAGERRALRQPALAAGGFMPRPGDGQ